MEGKGEKAGTQRLAWADLARGFCMMAILLFHTEKYYAGEEIIPYALYVDNVLITFFFISGYLFHNPQKAFSVPHKLLSILRGIIIPYFIFTAVIALPKAFVHDDTSLAETYADVLTGHASWFVAALAVAQVVFAFYVKISRYRPMALAWMCALPYLIIATTYHLVDSERWTSTNFWCWHNALLMLPFICAGYLFRRHSQWMTLIKRPCAIILMLISEVILKYWIHSHSLFMTLQPIHIDSFTLLLIDGLIGCLLIIAVCHWLPRIKWVEWTGAHSLVYYFICGGIPLLVTRVLTTIGRPYEDNYLNIIIAFILVYAISSAFSFFILSFKKILKISE
jgi:fucose 4-O-acetylase-like acetyltransferase